MLHLDRPFAGTFPVTQEYGVQNPLEPLGDKYTDGGIGYVWKQGAVAAHWHNGTDYAVPCGTPLVASADGVVSFAGWDVTGFGNRVSLDHGDGVQTLCGHMSHIDVTVGQKVTRGQRVGLSGTSGNSTGCHLHWSVLAGAEYVSPLPYLNAPLPGATPPPTPTPLPAAGHPPATAAEALTVLARHITALGQGDRKVLVNDLNVFLKAVATWPPFTT